MLENISKIEYSYYNTIYGLNRGDESMYYVYRFLDKAKNVIYVGKSKQDLEQRFRGHLHLPEECYNQVYKIEYVECSTESDMSIKEIYYINKYRNTNIFFNVLDTTELPTSVEFNDKWKQYKGPLGAHFHKSINYKKGYASEKTIRYNKDGSIDKRKTNKKKGDSSFVEGFSSEDVDLIIKQLIKSINDATNNNQEQIRFRNLIMFMISINLPLKTNDFLNLKYKDLFDSKDKLKSVDMKLSRFYKDEILKVPLRKNVRKIILAYKQRYNMTYDKNAEDYLFLSREHQIISPISWGRILSDTAKAAGITKSIGAESIRKTYGINAYTNSEDKLGALLFLGELWGHIREAQIIKYLNLTEDSIDYKYYFGEEYAIGKVSLSKIKCLRSSDALSKQTPSSFLSSSRIAPTPPKKDVIKKESKKEKPEKINRFWSADKKLEIIEKHLVQKIPQKVLAQEYNVDAGAISRWISIYKQFGKEALKDKRFKAK